jgi:hypothetical protein
MNRKFAFSLFAIPLCAAYFGLACKRDEAPPLATPPQPSSQAKQQMLDPGLPPGHPAVPTDPHSGGMPTIPPPPVPTGAEAIQWDLPKGWTEARTGGMRFATLKPPAAGKIDVSVIMLPGPAGGELGNVNRWRGQIGLPPVDDAGRAQIRKGVKSKAGEISLYDFASDGPGKQRMIAGLLFADGKSWFVKMVGDNDPVEATRADFVKLLGTLRFPAGK